MDAARCPSLALHFKAALKTGSGCRIWATKDFCFLWLFPKEGLACAKALKLLKQNEAVQTAEIQERINPFIFSKSAAYTFVFNINSLASKGSAI